MKTLANFLAIGLLVSVLIIELLTLFYPYWSTVKDEDFSLTTCLNCTKLSKNWSLECLARTACFNNNNDSLCDDYTKDYYAGVIYTYIQTACIFTTIFLLEKIIIITAKKDIGNPFIIPITLFINLVLQILAIILWWGYSGVSSNNGNVEANVGPKIGIFLAVWTSFVNFIILYFYCKQGYFEDIQILEFSKKLWGFSPKIWMILSLTLLLLGLCLIIASMSTNNWVKLKNTHGGLVRCKNCDEVLWLSWECLSGTECEINTDSSNCEIYTKLASSGKTYLILSSFSIILIIFSIQAGLSRLISRKYGIEKLNIAYLAFGTIFQFISTIVWASISKAKVSSDCKDDICGDLGIFLAISSNFFILPGAFLFIISNLHETYTSIIKADNDSSEDNKFINTHHSPRSGGEISHDTKELKPNTPITPYRERGLLGPNDKEIEDNGVNKDS
ncbi:hypothetical protein SteCoe_24410 [Stentor coeruleus]|uniref:Uncharacterized protein n=1 Tax=Stentor coeruleus TaxID=5963 RepID=A0A1R2BHX1_9CILI|nr:hypothetical protein SteCoe_24410 [Stentor coeruleus]